MSTLNEDDDDSSYDSDDLDDLLSSMDIDRDFQLFNSFRSSISFVQKPRSSEGTASTLERVKEESLSASDKLEEEEIQKWSQRLKRDEVYSRRYVPDDGERKELLKLETFLGIKKNSLRGMFRSTSTGSNEPEKYPYWNQLVHPSDGQPASILLKRGPVLSNGRESELLLLTHGLVIAKVLTNKKAKKNIIPREFERAILMQHMKYVEPGPGTAWYIQLKNQEKLEFICGTVHQQQAWLKAMEKVLIEHIMHSKTAVHGDLGWQYRYIHKPGFTMAVTGKNSVSELPKNINALDKYNGFAPLHYAVRHNHVSAIRYLLDAGADANVEDQEGRTPMYFAVRDELPRTTVSLLESYGAVKSQLAETEQEGELFGRIAATEAKVEQGRREQEQKRKAEAAQAQMNENMRLLQERGEKIDEMGSKADALNEGAQNYADMAKQLKEKSKNQKLFGLF